jgi:holo-[acyl-carrier protein] synthase
MNVIAHGIDLVETSRIAEMLSEHGGRFVERCFTQSERAYADDGARRRAERYAARFAAKEAVLKAIGTGWRDGISWQDVEVRRSPMGEPSIALTGKCAAIATELGILDWRCSLSHTDLYAIASVIALGNGTSPLAAAGGRS